MRKEFSDGKSNSEMLGTMEKISAKNQLKTRPFNKKKISRPSSLLDELNSFINNGLTEAKPHACSVGKSRQKRETSAKSSRKNDLTSQQSKYPSETHHSRSSKLSSPNMKPASDSKSTFGIQSSTWKQGANSKSHVMPTSSENRACAMPSSRHKLNTYRIDLGTDNKRTVPEELGLSGRNVEKSSRRPVSAGRPRARKSADSLQRRPKKKKENLSRRSSAHALNNNEHIDKSDHRNPDSSLIPRLKGEKHLEKNGACKNPKPLTTFLNEQRVIRNIRGQLDDGTASSLRRYALYRSMVNRLSDFLSTKKQPIYDSPQSSDEPEYYLTPWTAEYDEANSRKRTNYTDPEPNVDEPEIPPDKWDLQGTTLPKRVYIRETIDDCVIDEVVDIKDEKDWDILTYMSPLRHVDVRQRRHHKTRNLSFSDVKDFEVYTYVYPWRVTS